MFLAYFMQFKTKNQLLYNTFSFISLSLIIFNWCSPTTCESKNLYKRQLNHKDNEYITIN